MFTRSRCFAFPRRAELMKRYWTGLQSWADRTCVECLLNHNCFTFTPQHGAYKILVGHSGTSLPRFSKLQLVQAGFCWTSTFQKRRPIFIELLCLRAKFSLRTCCIRCGMLCRGPVLCLKLSRGPRHGGASTIDEAGVRPGLEATDFMAAIIWPGDTNDYCTNITVIYRYLQYICIYTHI